MAEINVKRTDNLGTQREKINTLSSNVGDIGDLTTPVTTDVVSAINSVFTDATENFRRILIRSIAMG